MDFEPFQIDTKGLCLLCLNDCSNSHSDQGPGVSSAVGVDAFKMLLRYLSVNIYDMYNLSPSFLQSIGASEDTSRVEISLCQKCLQVAKNVAKLYLDMELLRLKLDNLVDSLYTAMRNSANDPTQMEEFRRRLKTTKTMMGMINASAAEKLREETMQKCGAKINGLSERANTFKKNLRLFEMPRSSQNQSESNFSSDDTESQKSRHESGPSSNTYQTQLELNSLVKTDPTTTLEMNELNFTFPPPGMNGELISGMMEDGSDPLSEESPSVLSANSLTPDESVFNTHQDMELENENDEIEVKPLHSDSSSSQSQPQVSRVEYSRKRGRRPGTGTSSTYIPHRNRRNLFECPVAICNKGSIS